MNDTYIIPFNSYSDWLTYYKLYINYDFLIII